MGKKKSKKKSKKQKLEKIKNANSEKMKEELVSKNELIPPENILPVKEKKESIVTVNTKPVEEKPKSKKKGVFSRNKNVLFLLVYFYLFVRIFVTDLDLILVKKQFGVNYSEYIAIRFFLLSIIFFSIWKKLGNKRFWKNIGLFAALPFTQVYGQLLRLRYGNFLDF